MLQRTNSIDRTLSMNQFEHPKDLCQSLKQEAKKASSSSLAWHILATYKSQGKETTSVQTPTPQNSSSFIISCTIKGFPSFVYISSLKLTKKERKRY